LTSFGPPIGGSGASAWNEDINGGHYFLQEVWSNRSGGCEPRARNDLVSFRDGLASAHAMSVWFLAHASDPQGRIVGYHWFFGDGRSSAGRRASHHYAHAGQYRVILRTTDSWGNAAFYAATLTVTRVAGRPELQTKAG
jgi:PKD domain